MFEIKPKYLYQLYRFGLSDYDKEKASGTWNDKKVNRVDESTGEIQGERTVYIAKKENIGESMCLDDKEINGKSFSILSNQKTGKIAFMTDTVRCAELQQGLMFLGDKVQEIKTMNCDMAPGYLKLIRETLPKSTIVVDKFTHTFIFFKGIRDTASLNSRYEIRLRCSAAGTNGNQKIHF